MKNIIFTIITIGVIVSCKEEALTTPELISTQATQDYLFAEKIFEDISRTVEEAFTSNAQNKSCPSYLVINSDSSNIDTLIIDFGNQEPICLNNGVLRSGKIIVTYTGRYHDSLSVITTSFQNYYINYNLIEGELIIINKGLNNNGNMLYAVNVNDASINTNEGTINWSTNRSKEWISGQETFFDISDDRYKIKNLIDLDNSSMVFASGNSVNGNSFQVELLNELDIDNGCIPYCVIKKGTIKITPNNYVSRIVNYGDSLCDCNVNVLINENTYPIIIRN